MKLKLKYYLIIALGFYLISSCSSTKKIDLIKTYTYYKNIDNDTTSYFLWEIFAINNKGQYKIKDFDSRDSNIYHIHIENRTLYKQDYQEYFLGIWYPNFNINIQDHLEIIHQKYDTTNHIFYDIQIIYDAADLYPNKLQIELTYISDEYDYSKTYKVSDEVVQYYKDWLTLYTDSIDYFNKPPLPDLSTYTELINSQYTTTEYLSADSLNYKITTIDTTIENGKMHTKTTSSKHYYSKTKDSLGLYKEIRINPIYQTHLGYWEKHYYKQNNPIYEFNYQLDSNRVDTIYKMIMHTSKIDDTTLFHYQTTGVPIQQQLNEKKVYTEIQTPKDGELNYSMVQVYDELTNQDYRLPVVKRDIKVWRNKKGRLLKVHAIGYTDQGHQLEQAYTVSENYLVRNKIDNRKIPDISGSQIYDVLDGKANTYQDYNYPTIKSRKKKNYKSKRRKTFLCIKTYTMTYGNKSQFKETKRIEINRKKGYEKRVYENDYEKRIYEIYYK